MSIIESFKKTITFFDEIQKEGLISDYALIGGPALSAWIEPRTTKDIDLVVMLSKNLIWQDIASLIRTRLRTKVFLQKGNRRTTIQEKLSFMMGQIDVDVSKVLTISLCVNPILPSVISIS